jgi:hypothetical protein
MTGHDEATPQPARSAPSRGVPFPSGGLPNTEAACAPTIRTMWELEETVPERVRAFWARVVALYEAEQYGATFEEAFRVLDLAAVQRARAGAPDIRHFHNAVEWLRARSLIKPRNHPTLPGDLWTVAVKGRNHLTHHEGVGLPMVLNRATCDWTFPTFLEMLNELWATPTTRPTLAERPRGDDA